MHPKCGRWVLPPLLSALILYASIRGLAAWWELNTFPRGRRWWIGFSATAERRG
jgi:hypothetical protein